MGEHVILWLITAGLVGALSAVIAICVREERRHERVLEGLRVAAREEEERHHAAVMALYAPPIEVVTDANTRRALIGGYEAGRVMYGRWAASPPPGYGTVTIPYYDEKRATQANADPVGREIQEDAGYIPLPGDEP